MATAVAKKTFSIKKDIASQLDMYKNKSKFVNEALVFYIAYLESANNHKESYLEEKIKEALNDEFYSISFSKSNNINKQKYISHSKVLEKNLLEAIND